jgi:hypothetical protein
MSSAACDGRGVKGDRSTEALMNFENFAQAVHAVQPLLTPNV